MHRVDTDTAEVDKHGAGKNGFTGGTPPLVPPTIPGHEIFDAIQEEIAGIIEYAGITLLKGNYTQLRAAVLALITSNIAGKVTGPASATDNAVARFDLTTGKLVQDSGLLATDDNEIDYVTAKTRTIVIPAGTFKPSSSAWVWTKNRWEIAANASNNERLMAYFDVPAGLRIAKVEVLCRTEETGANPTADLRVFGFTTSATSTAISQGVSDGTQVGTDTGAGNGTTTDQIMEFDPVASGLPYPVSRADRMAIRMGKGSSAGSGSTFVIFGDVRLTLSVHGLRSV